MWGFGICGELVFSEGWYFRGVGICEGAGICGELVFVEPWRVGICKGYFKSLLILISDTLP